MTILQESLDVVTKYGKLTVPTKDVRAIEFGAHLADGLGKIIDGLIKDLGSSSFHDREAASNQLLGLGPKAYKALIKAARSKDLEVNRRAQTLVNKLREEFSAEQLLVRENDLIQTVEFSIIGRVITPTIRARTAYFGEPNVRLSQLRSIRWLGHGVRAEVTVEAAKYGNANGPWMDSGIEVSVNDRITIKATGEVDLQPANPGTVTCGPAGLNEGVAVRGGGGGGAGGRHQFGGALLGRIGEAGPIFVIGERYQGKASQAGKLQLQIVPNRWGTPSAGSYTVIINLGTSGDAGP
jgi:hypothetical protein